MNNVSIRNMDTFDCIATKLDIREYSKQKISYRNNRQDP